MLRLGRVKGRGIEKVVVGYSRPLLDNSSVFFQNKIWPRPQSSTVQDMVGIICAWKICKNWQLLIAHQGHFEFSNEPDRMKQLLNVPLPPSNKMTRPAVYQVISYQSNFRGPLPQIIKLVLGGLSFLPTAAREKDQCPQRPFLVQVRKSISIQLEPITQSLRQEHTSRLLR